MNLALFFFVRPHLSFPIYKDKMLSKLSLKKINILTKFNWTNNEKKYIFLQLFQLISNNLERELNSEATKVTGQFVFLGSN